MWILEMLSLLALSLLEGAKTAYGLRLLREPVFPFLEIWQDRQMYVQALAWAAVFGFSWVLSGGNIGLIRTEDLAVTYGILAAVDRKRRIVPDWMLACYLAGQLPLGALSMTPQVLLGTLLSGGIFGAVLWALSRFSGEKMGQGDVKLLCVTAMTAGWTYTFQVFALGLALSFLYGVYLLLVQRRNMRTEIPFVPFLAAASGILLAAAVFT